MTQYKRKRTEVWAERWTGTNYATFQRRFAVHFHTDDGDLVFETIDGNMVRVVPGDWVLEDAKGWPYPCKHEVFVETYEEIA